MGLVFIIIAQFLWALELILIRKFFPTQNAVFVSALTCVIGALFYLPALFIYKQSFTPREWIVLIILGITAWFLALICYVYGIQKSPSAFLATLATLLMPLFAVIMGAIFLHENVTVRSIIGGILMIAGFLIISL